MQLPAGKTAIIVVGPTASGKTSASLELASTLHTSIISADSRQCYREMNIGVAKPTSHELDSCKHYFINSHSIFENVDTVVFEQEALKAAKEIFAEKDQLILTGGTGLYVKVFCDGIDELPKSDPEIRASIVEKSRVEGVEGLRSWLSDIDPSYLQKTSEPENPVRLMRAIEVKLLSGRSILEYQKGEKKKRDFNMLKIGIEWPRDLLYQRINARVEKMMNDGLLEEAKLLYQHKHLPALQTVGYQELFDHLDTKYSLDEAVDKIKQHTRNYAKRQMTWFRKDPEIKWIVPDTNFRISSVF
jgi:tRNA dimethylallyltransferase